MRILRSVIIGVLLIYCQVALSEQLIVPPANVVKLAHKLSYADFPRAIDIVSIARVESGFDPTAFNPEISVTNPKRKAHSSNGIMQVQGGSFDLVENMMQGTKILREYYVRLKSKKAAVIAYNIGIGSYKRGKCVKSGAEYWARFSLRKKEYTKYNKRAKTL